MPNAASPPSAILDPRDIAAWREGGTGIDYVTTLDGGRPGPHVMVNALTHGNEISGPHAIGFLRDHDIRPTRGRLTLSFANVAAHARFDPAAPFASRYVDEDFNRVWDAAVLDGPRESVELARARHLRPIVDDVDLLLDLHSTSLPMAPMLLAGTRAKGVDLARGIGFPAHVVIDAGHAAGRRLRDYAAFDDPASAKAAILVECGQHFETRAARVAIETTLRFLVHAGVVAAEVAAPHLTLEAGPQTVIRVTEAVTINSATFAFTRPLAGFEVVPEAGTLIARDGATDIRTPYEDCVMVMPGNDLRPGLTAVRLGRIVGGDDG